MLLRTRGFFSRLLALVAAAFCLPTSAGPASGARLLHSNAIKGLPLGGAAAAAAASGSAGGSSISAAVPDAGEPVLLLLRDGGTSNKHQAVGAGSPQQPPQPSACAADEDCRPDGFCAAPTRGASAPGSQVCVACRRRRKRCLRDAMCCPGNSCNNGMCVPSEQDHFHPGEIEATVIESFDHGTVDPHIKKTTSSSWLHHLKGQEGAVCLRSSDCAVGLCCARHFWSKICKPVLKEGQVCTKHKKKGSHGLEIFQRCYCGDGLACRLQRDPPASNSSRLHTCQRH